MVVPPSAASFLRLTPPQGGSGFLTGYWLLATGYWLLATGYWLLRPPLGIEPLFLIHPEAFSDAVYVVEVGAHLDRVGDCPVRPARGSQDGDVRLRAVGRLQGQLLGVLQQCDRRRVKSGGTPIGREPIRLVFIDLRPEVVQVGPYSVVAVICLRGDHRDHLALSA